MRVEEEYSDVLLSIESTIVAVYESDPDLADRHVLAAIETLQRVYDKEKRARPGHTPTPSGLAGTVYQRCWRICEWYLDRPPTNSGESVNEAPPPRTLTISELLRVLKRLRKSVRLWHKEGGHRGYLEYVHGFIGNTSAARF